MQKATDILAVGYNGYGQLDTNTNSSRIINRFQGMFNSFSTIIDFNIFPEFPLFCQEPLLLIPLWSRILIGRSNQLVIISGSGAGQRENTFGAQIKAITSNEDVCLVLLANLQLWKVDLDTNLATQLRFLTTDRRIDEDRIVEVPSFISATLRGFYAITNRNAVYSIPTQIGSLPIQRQVIKLVSGFEHCLALLDNGDLYAWAGGL